MKIQIGSKIYDVIKEYKRFYLCDYKGLYKTCFLKWDVKNNRLYDEWKVAGSIAYTHKVGDSIKRKIKVPNPRFNFHL